MYAKKAKDTIHEIKLLCKKMFNNTKTSVPINRLLRILIAGDISLVNVPIIPQRRKTPAEIKNAYETSLIASTPSLNIKAYMIVPVISPKNDAYKENIIIISTGLFDGLLVLALTDI